MTDLSAFAVTGTNNPNKQVSKNRWNDLLSALETAIDSSGTGTFQPLDSDLTAIAALSTTAFGRSLLVLADAAALAAAHNHDGVYQPLDSDLTAIAALSTTSYGRAFLALANQAALMALLSYAVASDLNTGTDTTKVVNSDALAGSIFGKAVVTVLVTDPNGSALTTGDGKAYYRVPSTLNGMNLVSVAGAVTTVSSSGIPTIQIANATDAVDILSTKLTIDANETDSSTATTAAVIDTTKDDVATGDMLRIDVDVAGTGAKGLIVEMQFQLP